MSDYMMHLKIKIGYTSLKTQYLEEQEIEFPKLGGFECEINEMVDENDNDFIVSDGSIQHSSSGSNNSDSSSALGRFLHL